LWGDIEADSPEVQFLIRVNTRHNKEDAGSFGSSWPQPSKAEYYSSLVFFDNLQMMKMMTFSDLLVILTLTQKNKERGISAKHRRTEARARRMAQQPGPSGSPGVEEEQKIIGFNSSVPERPNVRILRIFFMPDISSLSCFWLAWIRIVTINGPSLITLLTS
jgi:hypothetical protein